MGLVQDTPITVLTEGELREADRVAQRLRDAVRAVLDRLPPRARTASGLARFAGVERTTCQRLVSLLAEGESVRSVLARAPGAKAVRALTEALRGADADAAATAQLDDAVSQMEHLFARAGGNQRAFKERLLLTLRSPGQSAVGSRPPWSGDVSGAEAGGRGGETKYGQEKAELLFNLGREMAGSSIGTLLQIVMYAPSREHPGHVHVARVRGFLGYRRRGGGMPLLGVGVRGTTVSGTSSDFLTLDGRDPRDPGVSVLLEQFSSITAEALRAYTGPGYIILGVEEGTADPAVPVDVVFADQSPVGLVHPSSREGSQIDEVWTSIEYPAEAMVCVVFQHRDLARLCIPGADVHMVRLLIQQMVPHRWATRLDQHVPLQVLGTGTGNGTGGAESQPSPFYDRLPELTEHVFRKMAWSPRDFLGYRLEVPYPAWRMAYRVFFDFHATPEGESPR